jgi:hypothetical protein
MTTNVQQMITELGGGQFESQLSHILSDVAGAVVDHGGKGKVVIQLDFKQISNSHQVNISHTMKFLRPTSMGSKSEDITSSTPMYVGTKGALSFFPENQGRFFDQKGSVDQVGPK